MAEPFTEDAAAVASRWRPLTAAEQALAVVLLQDAGRELLVKVPGLVARWTDGTLDEADIWRVQAAMVKRVLVNPEGVRSRTQSIDDFSTTEVRDQVLSAGELYATDDEIALLSPIGGVTTVGTIRLGLPQF